MSNDLFHSIKLHFERTKPGHYRINQRSRSRWIRPLTTVPARVYRSVSSGLRKVVGMFKDYLSKGDL